MSVSIYAFTFLRHAESVGNAEERFQGQADYPLTDAGRAQARALGERWRDEAVRFDAAVTSPLVRAKETAEIITRILKVPLEEDGNWVERDNGELSGLTRSEVEERFPRPPFITPYDSFGESGEGDWELYLRAGRAVHELIKRPAGKYLVVTHGGLLNKVMYAILGIPIQANSNGPTFRFENVGFVTFEYFAARHQWRMLRLDSPVAP